MLQEFALNEPCFWLRYTSLNKLMFMVQLIMKNFASKG